MSSPVHQSYFIQGFIGAVLINLVLFCSLPGLISFESSSSDIESLNLVYVSRFKPEPVQPRAKKEPPPEKEKPKPKIHRVKQQRSPTHQKKNLKLNLPQIDLDINPKITGGIPIVAPPPQPAGGSAQAGIQPDFDAVMDQSDVDTLPKLSFKRSPRYPYRAKRMGIEGTVNIRFLVDKDGNVSDIDILSATPPGVFNDSVIEAVSSWNYYPGELMGRKVATLVTTSIVFKLEAD